MHISNLIPNIVLSMKARKIIRNMIITVAIESMDLEDPTPEYLIKRLIEELQVMTKRDKQLKYNSYRRTNIRLIYSRKS